MTLEDFFKDTSRPIESQDIFNFWDNMFQLAWSLAKIRDLISAGTIGFHEYPVNLAPWNIFVVSEEGNSPYKWKFKLNAPSQQHHFSRSDSVTFYGVFPNAICTCS